MSIKILTKSGEEITAIDDARAYNFDAGNKSGIVKGALNEGKLFLVSSNVIGLDSCELRISGHRIVIDSAESITMANRPSVATRYSMIAEVVVSDASVPSFRLFIQPAKTELIQQNLYKTLNGNGTYQLRIGNFTLGTDGLISDIVRTADVISGATNGIGDIEFNVTTETIAGDLEPEVNVDFNEETKKYDMHFVLPLSSGTSVIENGEVVKRFNADSKVDKVEGKGLSTKDFTTEEKNKLERIESGATRVIVDASLNENSENPVQNKVVSQKFNKKANTDASNLTDENVESWKNKCSFERVETIYDKNSSDLNWGEPNGLNGSYTYSVDNKFKRLRFYFKCFYTNFTHSGAMGGVIELDLSQAINTTGVAVPYRSGGGLKSTMFFAVHIGYAKSTSSVNVEFAWNDEKQSISDGYFIYKIEGVY